MDGDPWCGTCRTLDPPQQVWVNLAQLVPPTRVSSADVPLRVRAAGLEATGHAPGLLESWHQTMTGDWFGLVRMAIPNRAQTADLHLHQLCPAAALAPSEKFAGQ